LDPPSFPISLFFPLLSPCAPQTPNAMLAEVCLQIALFPVAFASTLSLRASLSNGVSFFFFPVEGHGFLFSPGFFLTNIGAVRPYVVMLQLPTNWPFTIFTSDALSSFHLPPSLFFFQAFGPSVPFFFPLFFGGSSPVKGFPPCFGSEDLARFPCRSVFLFVNFLSFLLPPFFGLAPTWEYSLIQVSRVDVSLKQLSSFLFLSSPT